MESRLFHEFRHWKREYFIRAIYDVYSTYSEKQLYRLAVDKFSPGSVVATMVLLFNSSAFDPLKPLQDEVADAKLGQFTVGRQLYVIQQDITSTSPSLSSAAFHPNSSPLTETPANAEADTEWKKQELLLHAVYLSVISLVVALNIFLVVLLCRKPGLKDLAAKGLSFRRHDDEFRNLQKQGTQLTEGTTHSNPLNEAELHPRAPDQQLIYDTCSNTPPRVAGNIWEVKRTSIHIVKVIGRGAFCQVAKVEVWNLNGIKGISTVAVKMLKNPLLVLIEYIPYGDLLGFLRKSRGLQDIYFKNPDVKPMTNLTSNEMMQFAWQIADGMEFLSSSKVIHRDLAARNVLVGDGETCKVTDFGMARNVYGDDIYRKNSRGRLPVKWTAYEALLYGTYTTQSDVWSFGVVLYEIFTVGGCPYPGIDGREIANKLKCGYRILKPKHIDHQLYKLMLQCWKQKPNERPTFSVLKDVLTDMLQNNDHIYANMEEYNTKDYGYIDDILE